jgi:transposase, IS30 family
MLVVFGRIHPALRKSITFDNDTAFAQHALLRTMRAMTTWTLSNLQARLH